MEAELEAVLSGFDPKSFEVASPRAPRSARTPSAQSERGQEGSPGARTGKVISIRGKTIFVNLGGKSEGIISLDQFEGKEVPQPGSTIDVVVDRFDPEEGVLLLYLKGAAIEADWTNLKKGVVVEARVTKVIKGGVEVNVDGIRGFMPISQIDLARSRTRRVSSIRNSRRSSRRPNPARRTSWSPAANCWSRSGPNCARRPGPRSRKARYARGSSARSRTSAPSLISVA